MSGTLDIDVHAKELIQAKRGIKLFVQSKLFYDNARVIGPAVFEISQYFYFGLCFSFSATSRTPTRGIGIGIVIGTYETESTRLSRTEPEAASRPTTRPLESGENECLLSMSTNWLTSTGSAARIMSGTLDIDVHAKELIQAERGIKLFVQSKLFYDNSRVIGPAVTEISRYFYFGLCFSFSATSRTPTEASSLASSSEHTRPSLRGC
jgi:hypothetical protein